MKFANKEKSSALSKAKESLRAETEKLKEDLLNVFEKKVEKAFDLF